MKMVRILVLGLSLLALVAGCSNEEEILAPEANGPEIAYSGLKNGTEGLGAPSIAIAAGSGFVEGGVGMVDVTTNTLAIDVPAGTTIKQALLYWSGGTTGAPGDDAILIDGTEIKGDLIGGPVDFFTVAGVHYYFSAYRADITDLNLVAVGANSFTISGFDFDNSGGSLDENNGVSIVVIYDDGTTAELSLVDGLDMAFFKFVPTLDATVPQTFTFSAETADRTADLLVIAGSVGTGRPNQVKVTTSAGDQIFADALGSFDELAWDSVILPVLIPAGDTSLTVELISTPSDEPLGASLSWVAGGLSVPSAPGQIPASIGDFVWLDEDQNGVQDAGEPGLPDVIVHLRDCQGGILAETMTDADGLYVFADVAPGDYSLHFVLPDGYEFTLQNQGLDPGLDSDVDPQTGGTMCTTLAAGEVDLSWDAGLYRPTGTGCTYTIGFWKNHAGFRRHQDDLVTPLLPLWLGDVDGQQSIEVTDAATAVALLRVRGFGRHRNGIAKLYAQLLATKLNIANGANDEAVADAIIEADAFLASHNWTHWWCLSRTEKRVVRRLKNLFDDYNNGLIGPGHCDGGGGGRGCRR